MYEKIYSNFLAPFYENCFKKRNYLRYRRFLDKSQWWPKEKLERFQWEELTKLLQHAYKEVPYWQKVFKELKVTVDDIKTYADFQKLPFITKDDIRNNKNLMLASNFKGKTWTKATGGSTGMPLELDYTPDSYDWRMAVSKRGYSWAGCEDGVKQAYIWGTAIGKLPLMKKLKEGLHHRVLRQKYFNCFDFDDAKMAQTLSALNQFRPAVIVGYTNPLYNFTKFVKRCGNLKFKPKAVISAAEKLHDFQRQEIKEVFGCGVFNTYGSREFMLIASECEAHRGLHINCENLLVEIIKEDGSIAVSGETGEIAITDLHNYGMPFIRYKIGDLGTASDGRCVCGRGLHLLEDVVGRSLDMIRTPNGRHVPGEFFPHLMKEFSEVKQFQVIQNELDSLTIKIVKSGEFSEQKLNFMKNEIRKVIGNKIALRVDFVADIPLTKTGKHRVTVSNIADKGFKNACVE